MRWRRPAAFVLLGSTSFAISVIAVRGGYLPRAVASDSPAGETVLASSSAGPELALVYIGSPTCAWSNAPALPALIRSAQRSIREQAIQRGFGFASVGVARSSTADAGIKHLVHIGEFDELTAGRRWYNIGLLKYVRGELSGPSATPQLLIVERTLADAISPGVEDERVLVRLVGLEPIQRWVRTGAVLPRTRDVSNSGALLRLDR